MNNIHQLKILAHRLNRNRSAQEISTSMSPTVSEPRTSRRLRKPKKRKTSANQKLSWWMTRTHSSTGFETLRKRWTRTLTFLQKGIDTRNTSNAMVALITMKTSMSRAFSEQ